MKHLIILSWISITVGIALVVFSMMDQSHWTMFFYPLGNALLFMPNVIWILASNKIASAALKIPPSKFINALSIISLISAFMVFGLISSIQFQPNGTSVGLLPNPALDGVTTILFLTFFVPLITSLIMVSRRIIDTQESPNAGRGSRIFVLCICFFYIAIGMFFIAPKLKKLKTSIM